MKLGFFRRQLRRLRISWQNLRPIRVCFISYYAYRLFNETSQINFSGNELLFYLMARALAKDKKFKVSFILEDDVNHNLETEISNGVKLYKTSRQGKIANQDSQIARMIELYRTLGEKFDQLWQLPSQDFFRLWAVMKKVRADFYIQGSASYEIGLTAILSKLLQSQFIFLVNTDKDVNRTYVRSHDLAGKIFELGLRHTDKILCNSVRHQKILKQHYRLPSVYLPYWYPLNHRPLGYDQRKFILWAARIAQWKRPDLILKLARSLPRKNFILIAAYNPEEPQLFHQVKQQVRSIKNIQWLENLTWAQTEPYYQQALTFVDTSDYPGMHTSHLMAAAAGTPCLTYYQDPNQTFKKFRWGLCAHGDFQQMIKNLQLAVQVKPWHQLHHQTVKYATLTHDFDRNVNRFKKLLYKMYS